MNQSGFDPDCRRCDRLATFLDDVKTQHPDYFCRPVPAFGVADPGLLIVGLAPGMHGANATGRPFTGDYAGVLLYETLYKFGFADRPTSESADDGLRLIDCRITNAVKCLPPQNKPTGAEIRQCRDFLASELADFRSGAVVVGLAIALALAALLQFINAKTHVEPWHPTTTIINHGLFRFSRNPIYLAFCIATLGVGLILNSWWILLAVPLLVYLLQRFVISREEAYLEHKFGDEYAAYKQRVRRWF